MVPLITALTVIVCVGIHGEGLTLASRLCEGLPQRLRVAGCILGAMAAHVVEITLFAVAIRFVITNGLGGLEPPIADFEDFVYFSATSYTSLGFGDFVPVGRMRTLSGVEALTGLVLIAWTASFTYVEMQRYWDDPDA